MHPHKETTKYFAGSRQNDKKSNHKISTNAKQPPMLSSLHYPNHKPQQKSCITKTLPSSSLHPDNQTPIDHIKPPKAKPPNPSAAHYHTQSPLKKAITIYAPELMALAVALQQCYWAQTLILTEITTVLTITTLPQPPLFNQPTHVFLY